MEAVEKADYKGPVKVGIGTADQKATLFSLGCEEVFTPTEIDEYITENKLPMHLMFRPEDTIVMLQPGVLAAKPMQMIADVGCSWQVPGHIAEPLPTQESRTAWRRQKPKGLDHVVAPEVKGRPPKWPVPTTEQLNVIVGWWYSDRRPAQITEDVQRLMGAPVPKSWVRDQVIKATGSAARKPK